MEPDNEPHPDPEHWLYLDELTSAVDDLERCADFLEFLPHPNRWKWAIVALHQALYGFAICAVRGTDSRRVLKPPNKRGERHLISVWEALQRAGDPAHLWPSAAPLELSPSEMAAVDRLIAEFRNSFAHFSPKGWTIEVAAMAEVFPPVVGALRRLALESDAIVYFEADETRVGIALERLESVLDWAVAG